MSCLYNKTTDIPLDIVFYKLISTGHDLLVLQYVFYFTANSNLSLLIIIGYEMI